MVIDYHDFIRDLVINIVAAYVLMFQLYYRRHGDRSTAVALSMLNLFLFTIVIVVTLSQISIATGFALFAVLSVVSVRSASMKKIEIGYLFGVIALALINGMSLSAYTLLALCNLAILIGAFVLDGPWITRPTVPVEAKLDAVTLADLKDKAALRARVAKHVGGEVSHVTVGKYDPVAQTLRVEARLRL